MGARNYFLEIMFLRKTILYKTEFETLTVLPCLTRCSACFTDKYLWKTSFNKLRNKSTTPTTSKVELTNVIRGSSIMYVHFFNGKAFITNARLKWQKNQAKATRHPETEIIKV